MRFSKLTILAATVFAAGCAAKSRSEEPTSVPEPTPEMRANADSVRGAKFAAAIGPDVAAMKPVSSTVHLLFNPDAAREGIAGSAIVAFVVLPNGRVDRDTRTLLFVEGHQIYAKNVCDALNEMRFEPPPKAAGGAVAVFPVFFSVAGGAKRDSAQRVFTNTLNATHRKLATMSPDEAKTWFPMRPNCSAIKIGIERKWGR